VSVNRYRRHVFVLPEDDANHRIANGFLLEPSVSLWRISVLNEAGGWNEVVESFEKVYQKEMERFPETFMVLLIDFDKDENRGAFVRTKIPAHLSHRVFVLGALSEPEELIKDPKRSYETIGLALAKDCRDGTDEAWSHELLRHNAPEVLRLREHVRPILFP